MIHNIGFTVEREVLPHNLVDNEEVPTNKPDSFCPENQRYTDSKKEFSPRSGFWFYPLQTGSNLISNFHNLLFSFRGAHAVGFGFIHFKQAVI